MPLDELTPTHIAEFKGLFARGPAEVCPLEFFDICYNIQFFKNGFETRYGTTVSVTKPEGVVRFFPYQIEGQADRCIYLDNAGRIYDSLYPTNVILYISGMIDFSMIVLNDRAYLSPHNRVTGMPGEKVYVYQGGGVEARLAGGNPPSGFTLDAISNTDRPGNVEGGYRLISMVYETDSGFITKPGPNFIWDGFQDNFYIKVTNMQPGPPGTIARHVVVSKTVGFDPTSFSGNPDDLEIFFVDGGSLFNNTQTEIEINFYDSQLVRSADYVRNNMSTIPAVLGFTKFAGSLVGWAPNEEPSSVYLSRAGEPENISLLDGGIEVDISTGGGIRNCVEYRGVALMIHKAGRVYTTSNNGEEPAYWKVDLVDSAIGTEVNGIAAILDDEGNSVDRYVIATKQGLLSYEGNYENALSDNISDWWARITKKAFNRIQVVLNPHEEYIAIAAPVDGSLVPNIIFWCDYQNGLSANDVRWSIWTFPWKPTSIGIDVDLDGESMLKIGSADANLYFVDPTAQGDNYVSIPQPEWRTAFVGDPEPMVNYFGGIRVRTTGVGPLNIQFSGLDDVISINPPSFVMSLNPAKLYQREFNLSSQIARLRCWTDTYGARFRVTRISIYHIPEFAEEPA